MARLVLAYHKPGRLEGESIAGRVASLVSGSTGLEAEASPLEKAPSRCAPRGLIVALLPARGGHLAWLRESASRRGCRVAGPVPGEVVASYIVDAAGLAGGCGGTLYLAYWRAKRLTRLQEEDLSRAALLAQARLGARVELAAYTPASVPRPPEPGACAVVASMLPGRLPGVLARAGWRVVGEYVLSSRRALDEVVEWASREAASVLSLA